MYKLESIIKRHCKSWNFQRGGFESSVLSPATSGDVRPISAAPGILDAIWEQPVAMEKHDARRKTGGKTGGNKYDQVWKIEAYLLTLLTDVECADLHHSGSIWICIILHLWILATQLLHQGLQSLCDSPKVAPPTEAADILAALWSWPMICDACCGVACDRLPGCFQTDSCRCLKRPKAHLCSPSCDVLTNDSHGWFK